MQNMRRVQPMRRVPYARQMERGTSFGPDCGYAAGPMDCHDDMTEGVERMERQDQIGFCLTQMPSLAMVYAPCQDFVDLYDLNEGLKNGTIFRALNLPFRPGYGKRGDGR